MVRTHTVTDIGSLQTVMSLGRGSRVEVALPPLPTEESTKLQDQINRLISECGCSMSACALIGSVIVCGLFDATHWPDIAAHIFKSLGINLGVCFGAAGLGKTVALYRAKRKLVRTVEMIRARLSAIRAPEELKSLAFEVNPWDA